MPKQAEPQSNADSKRQKLLFAGFGIVAGLMDVSNTTKDDEHLFGKDTDTDSVVNNLKRIVERNFEEKYFASENFANCLEKARGCAKEELCNDSCFHKLDKEEELIVQANFDLEKVLKEIKPKALEATESAVKAYCEAADSIKVYIDNAYCAIDENNRSNYAEAWCSIAESAIQRCAKVKDAVQKGQIAHELLCNLREIIESGKNCKYTSCNLLLVTGEETLCCAEQELQSAKCAMDCVESDSRLVKEYKSFIEKFRVDLQADLDSLTTQDSSCGKNAAPKQTVMLLSQAYKKAMSIQKELAKLQGIEGYPPLKPIQSRDECDVCGAKKAGKCRNEPKGRSQADVERSCKSEKPKCGCTNE